MILIGLCNVFWWTLIVITTSILFTFLPGTMQDLEDNHKFGVFKVKTIDVPCDVYFKTHPDSVTLDNISLMQKYECSLQQYTAAFYDVDEMNRTNSLYLRRGDEETSKLVLQYHPQVELLDTIISQVSKTIHIHIYLFHKDFSQLKAFVHVH